MMRDVLQTIVLGRTEEWEHAKPVGNEIVPEAIAQQDMMRCLVSETGELVLPRADEKDRDDRDRHVEPDRPVVEREKVKRGKNHRCEIQIRAQQIKEIRDVIGPTQRLQPFLDARIAQRGDRGRSLYGSSHDVQPNNRFCLSSVLQR